MTIEMFFMFVVMLTFAAAAAFLSYRLFYQSRFIKPRRDFFWALLAFFTISTKPFFMISGQMFYFLTGNQYVSGLIYKMSWQFSAVWFAIFILFFMGEYLRLDVMRNRGFINAFILMVTIFSSFYEFGKWNLRLADGGILDSGMNAFASDVMLAIQGFIWLVVFAAFSFLWFSRLITTRGSARMTERYKAYGILMLVGIMIPLTDIPATFGNVYNTYLLYVANFWMILWLILFYMGLHKLFISPDRIFDKNHQQIF